MFQTPRWFREFESAVLCRQPKEHPSTIPADSTKNLAALTRDWGVRASTNSVRWFGENEAAAP